MLEGNFSSVCPLVHVLSNNVGSTLDEQWCGIHTSYHRARRGIFKPDGERTVWTHAHPIVPVNHLAALPLLLHSASVSQTADPSLPVAEHIH